jgi:dTDP-4-dehydrorhamnose reductase
MMPKILILGAGGMLGHKMLQVLSTRFPQTYGTLRSSRRQPPFDRIDLFAGDHIIDRLDVSDLDRVDAVIRELRPDVVVNCAGVVKQRTAAQDPVASITVNALLPHRLAQTLAEHSGRLIHFSTDCVFSGEKGNYVEGDFADAYDLYGRTKFLGEVATVNALTLRTSIIGRELQHFQSLLEWFIRQSSGIVSGYTRVFWSGVTTIHLSRLVTDLIVNHTTLHGLYHVSSGRISKYDLLLQARDAFGVTVRVEPETATECDRSLIGTRFEAAVGYRCPPWPELIQEVVADPTPYSEWLGANAIA